MHRAIFVLAAFLLIGSVSIVKCYNVDSDSDEEYQAPLDRRADSPAPQKEECEEEPGTGDIHSAGATCSGCKPDQICTVPNKCSCPSGPSTSPCQKQTAGLCSSAATQYSPSLISIDFGTGTPSMSAATPASFGFSTTYKQVTDSTQQVQDGSFAFVNVVPTPPNTWLGGGVDHTSGDKKGYMMLVNAAYGAGPVLKITVNDLIVGLRYQFSAYIANINKKGTTIILPDILIEARTATSDNTLLASTPTGKIAEESTLTWKKYGMSFITPSSSVVLTVISNAGGGGGDDWVIDDILFSPCAPVDNVVCSGK